MQTPGRQIEPQTPMIPVERRSDVLMTERLQRATEESAKLERPQTQVLGRIISSLDDMNSTIRNIRQQIQEDIKAKKNYYRDEAKLLKKDSDNLGVVKSSLVTGLRRTGAAIAGASGLAALGQGNIGGAAQGFGLAGALLSPEITEFLTNSVVNVLALKGLIGNKGGAGAPNVGGVVRGASKSRNPLLITAALAASLLVPALAKSTQSGDQRRQELATKVLTGDQTINKPDVTRFRRQLSRFDAILSGIIVKSERPDKGAIDFSQLERKTEKDEVEIKPPPEDKEEGFFQKIGNFFNFNKKSESVEEEPNKKNESISFLKGDTNINLASTFEGDTTIEGDSNLVIDDETKISLVQELSENNVFKDQITNIFETNETLASNLLPNQSIKQMGNQILSGGTTNNVIELPSSTETKSQPSGFQGITATPPSVSVSTKFRSGGGVIDRFEASLALRADGALV